MKATKVSESIEISQPHLSLARLCTSSDDRYLYFRSIESGVMPGRENYLNMFYTKIRSEEFLY